MALLFLSYRMATATSHVGRLHDRLAAHFGEAAIFYDRGSLNAGDLWRERIAREVEDSAAVLAVIDPHWTSSFASRAAGEDIVQLELETAIRHQKTILPILVGEAKLPSREHLPVTLHQVLDHHALLIDETAPAGYSASIARLIGTLETLDGLAGMAESKVSALLIAKSYPAAERMLMRQSAAVRQKGSISLYLALARLGGRSFNALHPVEREAVEALLRRARADSPTLDLPEILLAILEIDYYQMHGLVSAEPPRPETVWSRTEAVTRDARSRSLLSNLSISRRARRELGLDAVLSGGADD